MNRCGVVLDQFSSLDLGKLLPVGRQAFDRNLAEPADQAGFEPPLKHMLCIAAIKDKNLRASAKSVVPYLNLFHAGFLILMDELYAAEVLELAGLPAVMAECNTRGLVLMFIAGNLEQWRGALIRGCKSTSSPDALRVFNKVYSEFKRIGIASAFETKQDTAQDGTFYLEQK